MELITVSETMRRLSLGRTKVYQLLAEGHLQSIKIGMTGPHRVVRIDC